MVQKRAGNLAGESFSPGAHWKMIQRDGDYLDESGIEGFHATSVPSGDNPTTKKRNFTQQFDRIVF